MALAAQVLLISFYVNKHHSAFTAAKGLVGALLVELSFTWSADY